MGNAVDALAGLGGRAHEEHLAGIAVVAVLDDGDVDVDDVAVFELFVAGDAMADLVVDRSADGFGKPFVVEGGGDGLLFVDDVVVADAVQCAGGHAGSHMRFDHVQHIRRQATGDTHFFHLFLGFYMNGHGVSRYARIHDP